MAGHFFADLTKADGSFAGAELATARGLPPPPDASPSEVMRAYVQATKSGDEKLWLALCADWVAIGGRGRPLYASFRSIPQLHERLHPRAQPAAAARSSMWSRCGKASRAR